MKSIILALFLCFTIMLCSDILEVDINGTTPYTVIQTAINASATGDTVLVHPGTYYENIILENISVTLTSLEMTTGDSTYIAITIIDGNQNGSCIYAENITNTIIQGFTIQNGSGFEYYNCYNGGGLFIRDSELDLNSCIISENSADIGDGCIFVNSSASLSNNQITNNFAHRGGRRGDR